MDSIEIVKAYFAAIDSADMDQASQYLSEDYELVDFVPQPMDRDAMLRMKRLLKAAMPDLSHSLSNIRMEGGVVKLTVQISGTNSGDLDLRPLGLSLIPRSQKFIIFPNANYEITVEDGKIITERDVSPVSPNRRMSGLLKSFGVNMAAL